MGEAGDGDEGTLLSPVVMTTSQGMLIPGSAALLSCTPDTNKTLNVNSLELNF